MLGTQLFKHFVYTDLLPLNHHVTGAPSVTGKSDTLGSG